MKLCIKVTTTSMKWRQKGEGHIKAKETMDAAGNNPEELKKWQDQFMQTYNMAPEE